MNWGEKAEDRAGSWPTDPEHADCLKCRINEQVREGFIMGAKWQRDQLRTNETIERVAELFSVWIGCPECAYLQGPICDRCKDFAEWAITALPEGSDSD